MLTGRGRGTSSSHPHKPTDHHENMLTKLELEAIEGCLLRQREGDEERSGRIKVRERWGWLWVDGGVVISIVLTLIKS